MSGTKAERVRRIIGYFANLITKEVSDEASPGERFYKYLPELARRDRENLLANQIITKDLDIEHGFETATRFLFESRLGLKLIEMAGSEHPRRMHPVRRASKERWGQRRRDRRREPGLGRGRMVVARSRRSVQPRGSQHDRHPESSTPRTEDETFPLGLEPEAAPSRRQRYGSMPATGSGARSIRTTGKTGSASRT